MLYKSFPTASRFYYYYYLLLLILLALLGQQQQCGKCIYFYDCLMFYFPRISRTGTRKKLPQSEFRFVCALL